MKARIIHIERVSSTQDVAKKINPMIPGTVIVADTQDSGRGQHGHKWISPRGGLYASFILPAEPLISIRVGVALARSLKKLRIDARLKWPNDVLVDEKKIAGILIEAQAAKAIVGIGLNIHRAPLPDSTCVTDQTTLPVSRDDLVVSILGDYDATRQDNVIEAYRELCTTLGRQVQVNLGTKTLSGEAYEINNKGHLILKIGDHSRIIHSGQCKHIN